MKKLAIAAFLTTGVLALSACSSSDGETVVESNAGDITKEDYYNKLNEEYGESVLQSMIIDTVLDDKYDVSDDEIDAQLQEVKDQYGDSFESALQSSGYADEDAFKEAIKSSLLQQKAAIDGIEVTDEEIQERYDRLQTQLNASHILVADEDTANEVKEKLDDGEDWDSLVEEYSTDTATVEANGSLDWFSAGDMDSAFEDAAYSLETGEISDPVESSYGWHIIRLDDTRDTEEDIGSLEDMRDEIETDIAVSKVDSTESQEKINTLLEEADVDVKIDQYEDIVDEMTSTSTTSG